MSALLLLYGAAAQPPLPKVVPAEIAAERVKACGFDTVRVVDDRDLQEEVVEVSGVSTVPEDKMRCVVQVSLDTVRYVAFPEPANSAYWRVYTQMEREQDHGAAVGWVQSDARAWLKKHGLLGKVPKYKKGKVDDLQFGRELEVVCGPQAKGTFIRFRGQVTLSLGPPDRFMVDYPTLECLLNAIAASGMPFGFVGHEYYGKR